MGWLVNAVAASHAVYLPQAMPGREDCERELERLAEHAFEYRYYYRWLKSQLVEFLADTVLPRKLAERLPIPMLIAYLYRLGSLDGVGYEGGFLVNKFNRKRIDLKLLVEAFEKVAKLRREMKKILTSLDAWCGGVEPRMCPEQVRKYVELLEELWEVGINPNYIFRDLRMLARYRPREVPKALRVIGELKLVERDLLRCLIRWYVEGGRR